MGGGSGAKTCLFSEDLVARELTEVQELQVQGPKLRQDAAAPGRGPAPAPVGATGKTEVAIVTPTSPRLRLAPLLRVTPLRSRGRPTLCQALS